VIEIMSGDRQGAQDALTCPCAELGSTMLLEFFWSRQGIALLALVFGGAIFMTV
jgi:hypothetical protein